MVTTPSSPLTWNWSSNIIVYTSSCQINTDCGGNTPLCDPTQGVCVSQISTGTFRYSEDDPTFANAVTTTSSSYTAQSPSTSGTHVLYVEELGQDGSWSLYGLQRRPGN